jgi:hypothetical protein
MRTRFLRTSPLSLLLALAPIGCSAGDLPPDETATVEQANHVWLAEYRFENNANDSTSFARHGTVMGGATYTTGYTGQAININTGTQYVDLPDGLVSGCTDFSFAAWVRLDANINWSRIFDFGSSQTVNMFLTPSAGSASTLRFAIKNGGTEQQISYAYTFPLATWTHVAVTLSGNTGKLYVNGVERASNTNITINPNNLGNTVNNWLGKSQYPDPNLDGRLDDVKLSCTAMTSAEISSLYTNGVPSCTPPAAGTSKSMPLFTSITTADPAPLVDNCTFYITAGRDQSTSGFVLNDWYILSSSNMTTWSYNTGPKMSYSVYSWSNGNAWASQMVKRSGTYYWYTPVRKTSDGSMAIGVAKSTNVFGPFTDAKGSPLIDDSTEMAATKSPSATWSTAGATPFTIDPTVFVDADGQAYLVYGGFDRMVTVKLNTDMISTTGSYYTGTPSLFFEAPFLFKRNSTYYMVYAAHDYAGSPGNPAAIDYATATSALGPWTRQGRILAPLPNNPAVETDAATSHPGVAEFAGQWYLVYHRSDGTASTYSRQTAIKKLTFNADGTIQSVSTTNTSLTF